MRDAFHEALDTISDRLVEMTRLSASAMRRATTALLDADEDLAEGVVDGDARIDALRDGLDQLAVDVLARQQPVATDLRIVVTALHMATSLERMGDLAAHVAKIARRRAPESAVPAEMRDTIVAMGQIADRLVLRAGSIIATKAVDEARGLGGEDDEMDALHRRVFSILADESWPHPADVTVDMTLLSRYYERFADHAVAVARQVVYLVTGEWHSLDDIDTDRRA